MAHHTSRDTSDRVIAHADLLRALDRLLEEAQTVRQKRETLERLLSGRMAEQRPALSGEGRRND
jgi:hypothetical protein